MTVDTDRTPADTARETPAAEPPGAVLPAPRSEPDPLVERELLVEDVSIDGMCGVY